MQPIETLGVTPKSSRLMSNSDAGTIVRQPLGLMVQWFSPILSNNAEKIFLTTWEIDMVVKLLNL